MSKLLCLSKLIKGNYFWLALIVISGFLIRFWLLDKRWINPDEGAHLMDGRLVLDGFVPEVDYDSRQVFYVYIIAFVLKILGTSYVNARFLPLITSLAVSLLVFFISKKLFDEKVALLASAIYTFLPLAIIESTIVKTEPLTTFLSCLGIYLVITGVENEKRAGLLLFLSGVFLSFAYYVRESSLAILVAIFLFIVITYRENIQRLFKNFGFILSGYIFVCLSVFAFYSQFMTLTQIWDSSINPLNIILRSLLNIFSLAVSQTAAAEVDSFRLADQDWSQTINHLGLTLYINSFLFTGFLFSIFILVYSFLTKTNTEDFKEISFPFSLLYSWIFCLTVFYSYWIFYRGFFIQYFAEFLPPLTILLAFVIIYSSIKLELQRNLVNYMVIIALFLIAVFIFHRMLPNFNLGAVLYAFVATSVLSIFWFFSSLRVGKRFYAFILSAIAVFALLILIKRSSLGPVFLRLILYLVLFGFFYSVVFIISGLKWKADFKKAVGFIAFSLLISSFVLSFAVSGRKMNVAFYSVWSPETVKETVHYIKTNSKENDEIMSGAVIWELDSNRKPFLLQSHPLAYKAGIPEDELKEIERNLSGHPPKFIVLDGYTEQTYLRHINNLQVIMDEKYELKKDIDGSRYPVKIYELKMNNPTNE